MTFEGLPKEMPEFLNDLRDHNDKAWFERHRDRYEEYFLKPARGLVEALAPVVEALDPPHAAEPKINKSIRKIHRDVRFSKDKSPFDPRLHLIFWSGDHPLRSSGLHLVFQPDGWGYGSGFWAFDPQGLARYRNQVLDPKSLRELEEALSRAASAGCELGEPELVRSPRGFEAGTTASEWLRRKGLVARTQKTQAYDTRLFTQEAVPFLVDIFAALVPLNRWIRQHVESG